MSSPNIVARLRYVFRHHPYRLAGTIGVGMATCWGVLEPAFSFFPNNPYQTWDKFLLFLLLSIIVGLSKELPKTRVSVHLKNTNTTVSLVFGDIFKAEGHKIISVNEFFDSELGRPVSETSLHGKFITSVLGGQSSTFDTLVNQAIDKSLSEKVRRSSGLRYRYPIGTTAAVTINDDVYYLLAFAHTDTTTLKAHADVVDLWTALQGVWQSVRIHAGGRLVNIPLIGTGLSGVGIPSQQVIHLILTSILVATKEREVTRNICVVLPLEVFEQIDLRILKEEWS